MLNQTMINQCWTWYVRHLQYHQLPDRYFSFVLCDYCSLIRRKFLSPLSEIHGYHRIMAWFELEGDLEDHLVPNPPALGRNMYGRMCPRGSLCSPLPTH